MTSLTALSSTTAATAQTSTPTTTPRPQAIDPPYGTGFERRQSATDATPTPPSSAPQAGSNPKGNTGNGAGKGQGQGNGAGRKR